MRPWNKPFDPVRKCEACFMPLDLSDMMGSSLHNAPEFESPDAIRKCRRCQKLDRERRPEDD